MTAPAAARGDRGFTLVELLVAVTLLGLLMAALLGGLRLGARVWETAEARLDAAARVQIVQDFLRQRIAEAMPVELPSPDRSTPRQQAFQGDQAALRFAGSMPEHLGAGVYLMELALAEPADGGEVADLVLRWQPLLLGGTDEEVAPPEPEQRVLLEGVAGLELAYFGILDPEEPPSWWPEWLDQDLFPGLVRLQLTFPPEDLRQWPELVVRPVIDVAPPF